MALEMVQQVVYARYPSRIAHLSSRGEVRARWCTPMYGGWKREYAMQSNETEQQIL